MFIKKQSIRDSKVYSKIWEKESIRPPAETILALCSLLNANSHIYKSKILDIGCGNGRHSLYFASKGHDVTAIDHDIKAINTINSFKYKHSPKYDSLNTYYDNFFLFEKRMSENDKYDAIVLWDAVHHMMTEFDDLPLLVDIISNRLKINGYLAISFLTNIRYSSGEIPDDRLLINNDFLIDKKEIFRKYEVLSERNRSVLLNNACSLFDGNVNECKYTSQRNALLLKKIID